MKLACELHLFARMFLFNFFARLDHLIKCCSVNFQPTKLHPRDVPTPSRPLVQSFWRTAYSFNVALGPRSRWDVLLVKKLFSIQLQRMVVVCTVY